MPQKPQHSASNVRIEILELYTRTGTVVLDPFLINMNIYENLWGDFVSCDMILNDSVNLPFHAPIIGDELLRCRFATKSLDDVDLPMMYLWLRIHGEVRSWKLIMVPQLQTVILSGFTMLKAGTISVCLT